VAFTDEIIFPSKTKTPNTAFEASSSPEVAVVSGPKYSNKEAEYRSFLLKVLEVDRDRRESPHVEFNGMTYTQNYRTNMLAANSYTPPRKNAEDTQVVTGTTREKVLAIVSSVLNLNFQTQFIAFDKDDIQDEELAEAMTDCVERANKIEQWDDKKLYAYFEMAVQGDVYVEESFVDETVVDKPKIALSEVTEALMQDYKADYKTKVTYSGCVRNLIPGTQVFKGSMTERDFSKQPHIFTREVRPYEVVKSIYGKLPRWQSVPRHIVSTQVEDSAYGTNWRLQDTGDEECEIIKYQDKWNDEYQIIINGVMMLPVGFPMPWEHQEYNIVQGRLEPISAFFSESKSVPCKTKLDQEILDEMYRLAVLKTQKSFMPPIANFTTNILSKAMFLPGKVNNNLQKGDIEVLGGDPSAYSMKPSEFEMIKMIKEFIDQKSISPILQGQSPSGEQTATEVNTITQQAKQQLGLLMFGFIQFHMNLDMLRLYNLLENYTKANGQKLDQLKQGVVAKYRNIAVYKDIGGKGQGVKHIQFTDQHNTPAELYDLENGISRDPGGKPLDVSPPKKPVKILQVSPKALRSVKYSWYAEVTPTERETTLSQRIEFTDQLINAMKLFGQQSINVDYAQQVWASKNKLDANSFFSKGAPMQAAPAGGSLGSPEESNMTKQARPYASGAGPAEAMRQGIGN
jgi:hypothetical protein